MPDNTVKKDMQRNSIVDAMKQINDARFALEMSAIEFGDSNDDAIAEESKELTRMLQRLGTSFL